MLKDFIWDFDGTLYDTYPIMTQSFIKALQQLGVHQVDAKALYRDLKIRSVRAAAESFAAQADFTAAELAAAYHQIEHAAQQNPRPYPGAVAVLLAVVKNGGRNFLDTHRDQSVYQYLKQDGLWQYFSGGVDANQDFPRKPDPSAINAIVNQYHLNPQTTAMVGDRQLDIVAGQNAHVQTIYFNVDGYDDAPNATYQVDKLSEILELLAKN